MSKELSERMRKYLTPAVARDALALAEKAGLTFNKWLRHLVLKEIRAEQMRKYREKKRNEDAEKWNNWKPS